MHAFIPVMPLFAGDVISLGDRQLTVMHMPGHSRGSICLHDREHKILFSGDVVYDGSMIDWLPYSRVSDYVASCQRLMELVDRGLVEKVLPGHFNIFGAERLYRLASNYISQAGFCHKVSTCAMRSIASIALRVTNSRGTSSWRCILCGLSPCGKPSDLWKWWSKQNAVFIRKELAKRCGWAVKVIAFADSVPFFMEKCIR